MLEQKKVMEEEMVFGEFDLLDLLDWRVLCSADIHCVK